MRIYGLTGGVIVDTKAGLDSTIYIRPRETRRIPTTEVAIDVREATPHLVRGLPCVRVRRWGDPRPNRGTPHLAQSLPRLQGGVPSGGVGVILQIAPVDGGAGALLSKAMGTATGLQRRGVQLKGDTADYSCPMCGFSTVPRANGTSRTFQCGECGCEITEVRK